MNSVRIKKRHRLRRIWIKAKKRYRLYRIKNYALTVFWSCTYSFFFLTKERKLIWAEIEENLSPIQYSRDLIRVGSCNDGGYVIPDDSFSVSALFSPGVGANADFELEFAKRGITCFLADYSVEEPPVMHKNFHFEKKYIGSTSTKTTITLQEWLSSTNISGDNLFLSMDIEGSEFEVLMSTSANILKLFKYITIEIHDLNKVKSLSHLRDISTLLRALTENHKVIHIHPNNFSPFFFIRGTKLASVIELTLLRKDSLGESQPARQSIFLKNLDSPNDPHSKDRQIYFRKR